MLPSPRRLAGLHAPVDLWRDAWGVPHIKARGVDDAFFAMGYVHAIDRLWQMDVLRRRTVGRYAEWVGATALPSDVLARRLDLAGCCQRDLKAANPETRAMLASYAAGVNAAMANEPLPVEYARLGETPEPWQDWHSIAVLRQTSLLLNSVLAKLWRANALPIVGAQGIARLRNDDGGDDLVCSPPGAVAQRVLPDLAALAPAISALGEAWPADAAGGGSNNWALSGARTASGKPLLAGDPHRLLDMPNMYLQCHVACDAFDVVGLTSPGLPGFPHFAHNAHVAWGVTVAFVDTADIFLERFRAEGRQYLASADANDDLAEWVDVEHRVESIAVRGRAEPERIDVFQTARGPVVAGDPRSGRALTLRTASEVDVDRSFDCLLPMLRAVSVDTLYDACEGFGLIDHNLVAADTLGHIGHLVRARVPRRPAANGWLPVPGWLAEHAWNGWVPFAAMPRQVSPPGGVIVTANNRVVDKHDDYLCTDCHPPHRARRIMQRLAELSAATPADMQAVHRDIVSLPAREICARLATLSLSGPAATLRDRLVAWDARLQADSREAASYTALRIALARKVSALSGLSRLDPSTMATIPTGPAVDYQLSWCVPQMIRADDTLLLGGASWDDVLTDTLTQVAAAEKARPVPTWGEQHRLRLRHPLAVAFPDEPLFAARDKGGVDGDNETVFTTGYVTHLGTDPTYASIARYVFDVGDWNASRWIVFHGTAGDPRSPHYDDQSEAWRRGETVPMLYDWPTIAREAASQQRLLPA